MKAILVAMAASCLAQNPNLGNAALDTPVPESPALTVLGLTPSSVTRPATPRALAASLLNGVDLNGNFQAGMTADIAPYMLFYGNQIALTDYKARRVVRFLARTQLSLASVKGASDADKSAKLAAGLNLTIFDKGDARTNQEFLDELAAIAAKAFAGRPPLSPNATQADIDKRKQELEAQIEKDAKAIRDDFAKKSWNRSSWAIAAAPSWISKDGTTSHLAPNGTAVWSSLAYGFEGVPGLQDNAQIVLHGRFHSNENVPDPQRPGTFYRQQSAVAGARLCFGTGTAIGSFETAWVHDRPADRRTDNYFRLTFGGEKKVTGNIWLHFGIGGESGARNAQSKLMILGMFQWGTGPK